LAEWVDLDGHEGATPKVFPKDLVSKIELWRALNAVSMKKEDDPAIQFEQIIAIENKYKLVNYQIPKEDRITTENCALQKSWSGCSIP
jgi:hypothetical protein